MKGRKAQGAGRKADETWKTFQGPQDLEALVFEGEGATVQGIDGEMAGNKDKRFTRGIFHKVAEFE